MDEVTRAEIRRILEDQEESTKKQIAINLEEATIAELDKLTRLFSRVNTKKNFSRNYLIESAIGTYIRESYAVLGEYGISADCDAERQEETENDDTEQQYDLVILASREVEDGFKGTFLGKRVWYPCRIKDERIPRLKYIAIYRGAPISGITHYAKIREIKYDPQYGEKTTYLDGEPIELPQVITLGGRQGYHFRSPKYVTLDRLLHATTADDLF